MSTEMSVAYIGAISAISAAIIGLFVAIANAKIAKEQKTSEFRQAWINELRTELSSIYLHMSSAKFYSEIIFSETENTDENRKNLNDHLFKIKKLTSIISLQLNPNSDKKFVCKLKLIKRNIDRIQKLAEGSKRLNCSSDEKKRKTSFKLGKTIKKN